MMVSMSVQLVKVASKNSRMGEEPLMAWGMMRPSMPSTMKYLMAERARAALALSRWKKRASFEPFILWFLASARRCLDRAFSAVSRGVPEGNPVDVFENTPPGRSDSCETTGSKVFRLEMDGWNHPLKNALSGTFL